ncbi:MAG: biopolymer transporter ExbD [Kiritimatiellae bacterium]|jgi:biopolymer transport protein ExbD|nr:biopolymer transporter ExbD [Kiritimatiellia bacterium]
MSNQKESWGDMIKRRRFIHSRFGNRRYQNFSGGIPWIDAIIIIVLLLAVNNRLTIVPGMVFELPSAPLRGGTHDTLTAVMVPVVEDIRRGSETLVFFDDERFSMNDEELLRHLSDKVRNRIQASSNHDLVLLADKNIPHGDVIRFVNIVREAGIRRVNVGEKPE